MDERTRTRTLQASREVYRQVALRSGGIVEFDQGVELVHGVHPSPVIANVAFRPDPSAATAVAVLGAIADAFHSRGRSASLITNPSVDHDIEEAARDAGWVCFIELTEMLCEDRVTFRPGAARPFELIEVATDLQHANLVTALAIGFGDGDPDIESMVEAVFADFASIEPPGVAAVVAMQGAEPVASGVLYLHDGVGVPGFIATVPTARRQGLGAVITRWLTAKAFDLGCDLACLESSPEGASVYRRVGYRDTGSHRVWLPETA